MVGITLLPEQIRAAPPEVRRWLDQQVADALGISRGAPRFDAGTRRLVGCTVEEAGAVLTLIKGMLPVVGVFLELGRPPIAMAGPGLNVLDVATMLRHTHLQSVDQFAACLEAIDEALRRVRPEPDATLSALDNAGHCIVAEATARSIAALWQEMVADREPAAPGAMPPTPFPPMPAPAFDAQQPGAAPPASAAGTFARGPSA